MEFFEIDYGQPPSTGWAAMVCELYVQDIVVSLEFWCEILGFTIAYQRPEERFVYLERRDGAQVMLYQPNEKPTARSAVNFEPKAMLQIFVGSLSPIILAVEKYEWPLLREPEDVWRRWGDRMGGKREIRLSDPDGNLVLVAENIGERPVPLKIDL